MSEPDFNKGATGKQLGDFMTRMILDARKHGLPEPEWTKDIPTEKLEKMLKD